MISIEKNVEKVYINPSELYNLFFLLKSTYTAILVYKKMRKM